MDLLDELNNALGVADAQLEEARAEVARLRLDLDAYAALEKLARDLGFANIASALAALELKDEL